MGIYNYLPASVREQVDNFRAKANEFDNNYAQLKLKPPLLVESPAKWESYNDLLGRARTLATLTNAASRALDTLLGADSQATQLNALPAMVVAGIAALGLAALIYNLSSWNKLAVDYLREKAGLPAQAGFTEGLAKNILMPIALLGGLFLFFNRRRS